MVIKSSTKSKPYSFQSKMERIADGMEYYALSVPLKITQTVGTRGPVPVAAQVNNSEIFLASFFPVGEGRHYLRVKNKYCKAEEIKEGDPVRVRFTVRDRADEISIPKDLLIVLRAEGVEENFKSLPVGKKSYLLRLIGEAAKPETRTKRIQDAAEEAHKRREKKIDRKNPTSKSSKARR